MLSKLQVEALGALQGDEQQNPTFVAAEQQFDHRADKLALCRVSAARLLEARTT